MSLKTSLISSWELNEASSNALDSHGSNTLTPTGGAIGAAAGPGGVGGSRDFEFGDTEWFAILDNASLSMGDIDFTIEIWVNFESIPGEMDLISKYETVGNQREYRIRYEPTTQRLQFVVSSVGTGGDGIIPANILGIPSTGTWYQIIAWHDSVNNELGMSVNNVTETAVSFSAGVFDGTSPLYLGALGRGSPTFYLDGLLSKCRIWKRILTSQEKTDLYNSGTGLAYTAFATNVSTTATAHSIVVNQISPSVAAEVNFQATINSIVFNNNAHSISGASDYTASPATIVVNLIDPSISSEIVFSTTTSVIPYNLASPAVITGVIYGTSPLSLSFNVVSPDLLFELLYEASSINIGFNLQSASESAEVIYTASPASIAHNIVSPSILTEVMYSAVTVPIIISAVSPAILNDTNYSASTLDIVFNIITPDFNNSLIYEAGPISLTTTTASPTVNTVSVIEPNVLSLWLYYMWPSVVTDSINSVESQALQISLLAPTAFISITSLANVVDLQATLNSSSVLSETGFAASPISLSFLAPHPTRVEVDNTGGDAGNLFDLTSMQNILKRGYDSLINVLGTPCIIHYPPSWEFCINCVYDAIGNKSSNRYKHGGPVPFQVGSVCSACNGVGKRSKEATESSKFLTAYDPKKFFYPVPQMDIRQPYAVIQLEGFLTDLPKLRRAEYVIIHADIKAVAEGRYRLSSEAFDDNNIVQGRYFFCTMEKV